MVAPASSAHSGETAKTDKPKSRTGIQRVKRVVAPVRLERTRPFRNNGF
jgi:hypothetical protein